MKESGLLPVLSRLMRDFNPKKQPRSYAADILQVIDEWDVWGMRSAMTTSG